MSPSILGTWSGISMPSYSHRFVGPNRSDEIDVSVIGKSLLEVEESALDIAEMHVEDLPVRSEIVNRFVDFFPSISEALGNCALAEIQSVIQTVTERSHDSSSVTFPASVSFSLCELHIANPEEGLPRSSSD